MTSAEKQNEVLHLLQQPREWRESSSRQAALAALRIRRLLLRWFDAHRRDLPWRRTYSPYRIWVSEVMLQQTRVEAVVPYYQRFVRKFPSVQALARASQQDVLACWSGLGYYSRARNLHRAAQEIVRCHKGRFPRDLAAALVLPGVGRYTAAAVLSIAYQVPLPVVDGNVARVLSRLYGLTVDVRAAAGKAWLWDRAAVLLSRSRPGDFNQALMELGATVCLPRQPRCDSCPIAACCAAFRTQQAGLFPKATAKPKPQRRRFISLMIKDVNGRLLLVRRPRDSRWLSGFWELPMWELPPAPSPEEGASGGPLPFDRFSTGNRLGTVHHTITRYHLEVEVYGGLQADAQRWTGGRWFTLAGIEHGAVTTVTRKALRLLGN